MSEHTTPLKAIRLYCLECTCNQPSQVKHCPLTECSLYPFRMGRNSYIKRELTDEQKQEIVNRLHRG